MNQRKDGRKVLTVATRFRAKIIAQTKLIEIFKASNDWCNRFLKRNQLSVRAVTSVSQKLPNDWDEKMELLDSMTMYSEDEDFEGFDK